MQKLLLVCVAVLALAFAQDFPQNSPPTITPINATVNDALGVAPNYNYSLFIKLYSLYVPSNAMYVNTTFTNLDYSNCGYINFWIRTHGLPCSSRIYNDGNQYMCANGFNPDDGISSYDNELIYAGWTGASGLFNWETGLNWYMGTGRYYSSSYYASATCNYQIALNWALCPAGFVSVQSLSSPYGPTCASVTNAAYGMMYNISGTQNSNLIYHVDVAQATGMLRVVLTSNSYDNYLYGKNYAAPSQYNYNCYTGSSSSNGNGTYTYTLDCYTPRAGDFYFLIYDSSESFNGTVMFSQLVCPMGMGGFNCSFPAMAYNWNNTNATTFTVPYNSGWLSYAFAYWYFDIPANFSAGIFSISATSPSTDAYMFFRRDGFPEDSSTYGYESSYERQYLPAVITLNSYDWAVPGRVYFGFSCYDSNGCPITVGSNSTSTSGATSATSGVSSGSMTTGMSNMTMTTGMSNMTMTTGKSNNTMVTTGRMTTISSTVGATTAQHTSGASIVVPFVALIAAFVALF